MAEEKNNANLLWGCRTVLIGMLAIAAFIYWLKV